MTKPRLQFQRGNWYCSVRSLYATRIGVGETPADAYADWQIRTNHPDVRTMDINKIKEILERACFEPKN